MADYKAPLEDVRFLMKDVFQLPDFWQTLNNMDEAEESTADAILEEAAKVCEQVLAPLNREADEQGCQWQEGHVTTPDGFIEAYQTFCEGGWGGLSGSVEYDGMGLPKSLVAPVEEFVQGSCMSFGLAPMLTAGACLAINAHADDALKSLYLPKMYSGQWSGAMDLTEPHCGTDLGLIRTKAIPADDSTYQISGTKIFITWGEHDMAENIVHLVLAKLPDAPPGSKGISLFLVPKFLPDANGDIGERNGVNCGSLEKKMGIKGSATCVMNFDNATGWLVGEPHRGLMCMFTMMNYERLVVGIQGVGAAQASYQNAAEYALERTQGRSADGAQQPNAEADPLIVHADVRRMLMTARAWVEASRAFYIYVAQFLDLAKFGKDQATQSHAEQMVALFTPIAKAFITDVSFASAVECQQVLGGHGFIREWGQEQHVRDIRITQIYEGTNGIQAMDLIGRKTVATQGKLLKLFVDEVADYLNGISSIDEVQPYAEKLQSSMHDLEAVTEEVVKQSTNDAHAGGAAAVDYLNLVGHVVYAYMWVKIVATIYENRLTSDFHQAKLSTADFYFHKLLPNTATLKQRILAGSGAVMSMKQDWF